MIGSSSVARELDEPTPRLKPAVQVATWPDRLAIPAGIPWRVTLPRQPGLAGTETVATTPLLHFAAAACVLLGMSVAVAATTDGARSPALLPLLALTLAAHGVVVLWDLRWALGLFIVTAGFSPKLPGIYDNLRIEDLILALIVPVWACRMARLRAKPAVDPAFRRWVALPYLVLLGVSLLATIRGQLLGLETGGEYGWLTQAKRLEYLLIAAIVATTVTDRTWANRLLFCVVAGGGLTALLSLTHPADWTVAQALAEKRVFGPAGENYNTLSAYLVVCAALGLALINGLRDSLARGIAGICVGLGLLAVLFSYSREGYVLLACMLLVLARMPGRKSVLGALALVIVVVSLVPSVRENALRTVAMIQHSIVDDPIRNSLTARYHGWSYRWDAWVMEQPLMGSGVGSVPLSVDSEYLLRTCEAGAVGFLLLLAWLGGVARFIHSTLRRSGSRNWLAWGLLGAFAALCVQATVAPAFSTIRPMETLWFGLGLLAVIPPGSRPESTGSMPGRAGVLAGSAEGS